MTPMNLNKCKKFYNGKLIVFEGIDGVGKSEFSKQLQIKLQNLGERAVLYSFPGKEPHTLGALVYKLHHNLHKFKIKSIDQSSLQLLHIASHIDIIKRKIIPSLRRGEFVILDRYWWSTLSYGKCFGVDQKELTAMINVESIVWNGIVPDILFYIQREKHFNDRTSMNTCKILTAEYESIIKIEKRKYTIEIIDNNKTIGYAFNRIMKYMHKHIGFARVK